AGRRFTIETGRLLLLFVLLHVVLFHLVLLRFRRRRSSSGFDFLGLAGDVDRHRHELAVLDLIERDGAVLGVAVLVQYDLGGDAVVGDLRELRQILRRIG